MDIGTFGGVSVFKVVAPKFHTMTVSHPNVTFQRFAPICGVFPSLFTQLAGRTLSDGITQETAPVLVAEPSQALDLLPPLVAEPVTAPVAVEQPAPTLAPVAAPEIPKPEFEHHSEVSTLLGPGEETAAVKPVEQPELAPVQPVSIPDAYDFKVPDDIRMTDAERTTVTDTFKKLGFDQSKADTALDAYYTEMRRLRTGLLETEQRRHQDAFMGMRRGWLDQIKGTPETIEKDGQQVPNPNHVPPHPILGQPGALEAVKRFRDKIVPPSDAGAWKEMCGLTGAGDHPALALAVYRAHEREEKLIAEYEAKITTAVAAALEPYQEARAPTVRGTPVKDPTRDPGLTGFQAFYERNSAAR